MKKSILLLLVSLSICSMQLLLSQSVGINATGAAPNSSAMLDVQSTSKGMLVPRMTTAQRQAIASPAIGLLVFDNTTGSFWFKNASKWVELIDSSNNIWSQKGSNVYLGSSGNVGIGTSSPVVKLNVDNGTDVSANGTGGFLQLGAGSLSNLAFDNNEIQARNNGNSSDLYMQVNGGNTGIGTPNAEVKLQVNNGTDVSEAGGGYLQLGAGSASNLAFDNNEVQARNNHAEAPLYLQNSGGNLQIGAAGETTTDVYINNGKLLKPATGGFNMIPLCYGHINADGSIAKATPNVSVTRFSAGDYDVKCDGITSSSIMIISFYDNLQYIGGPKYRSDGEMEVYVQNIKDVIDDPGGFQSNDDKAFYFVIYNP